MAESFLKPSDRLPYYLSHVAATRPISVRDNELSIVGLYKQASGLLRAWPVASAIDSYTEDRVTCFNVLHVAKVKREHLKGQ